MLNREIKYDKTLLQLTMRKIYSALKKLTEKSTESDVLSHAQTKKNDEITKNNKQNKQKNMHI